MSRVRACQVGQEGEQRREPWCHKQRGVLLSAGAQHALREGDQGTCVGGAEGDDVGKKPNGGMQFDVQVEW
eukprot:5390996-Pleurochrysis_carterae.AAC.1